MKRGSKKLVQMGVKTLIFDKRKEFLVIKRSAKKYPKMKNVWDIVGGRLNNGENIIKGLKREISEETGFSRVTILGVLGIQDINTKDIDLKRLTFISRVTSKKISLSNEHEGFKWVSLESLLKFKGLDKHLKAILKDKNVVSFIKTLINQ